MQQETSYEQAAELVLEYARAHEDKYAEPSETEVALLDSFQKKFGPDALKSLSDDNVLEHIFSSKGNKDSLYYHLVYNHTFGNISGGDPSSFGLFKRKEDGQWVTGSPKSPQVLSEDVALQLGKSIRDNLVKGCEIIKSSLLDSLGAYEKLEDELFSRMGKRATYAWVRKYFYLIFPEQFVCWYATDWLRHFLFAFGIRPSEKCYGMSGQLALVKKNTRDKAPLVEYITGKMFYEAHKLVNFSRMDYSGDSEHSIEELSRKGIVAIDGKETGDLHNYRIKENKKIALDWDKISEFLSEKYQNDKKTALKKARGLKTFYNTSAPSSVIIITKGQQPIAFVDNLHEYEYDENDTFAHQKQGDWHFVFDKSDKLPADEETNTACCEIKNTDNLLFLYRKFYQYLGVNYPSELTNTMSETKNTMQNTGYHSDFERNRIFFGAPGTGKSYTLNKEKDKLPGVEYERVTFHPDYSYANFVGTYKPVPCKDSDGKDAITYSYVPGPFMRTYVKALENSKTDTPKPFLLIIEEINRANVAAVFGDVFQLLDREDDGRSMYPIQASEDIRKYLAHELGDSPDDYPEISIPGNMFIWATMNSADQGVFPMDTAFKRRWDFTYLGIDESEAGIAGKTVVLGQGEYRRIVEWNALRKAINNELLTYRLNEDKLLGPYFLSGNVLPKGEMFDQEAFAHVFKNKVIMYLFDDAAKQKRSTLFSGCKEDARNQYSKICREFDVKGVNIFCDRISSLFEATSDTVSEGDAE